VAKHQARKATVAGFVATALSRCDQLFNLAAGEVFAIAAVIRPPCPVFSASFPFCREFPLSETPETCAKRQGALFTLDKMVHFVCWPMSRCASNSRTRGRTQRKVAGRRHRRGDYCILISKQPTGRWKSRLSKVDKMKLLLPCALLIASAGLMQASIIQTISFNLSALHAGSTLSGTFALSNSPLVGDTAPAALTLSDPSDYSLAVPLSTTITIASGTPSGFAVLFSELAFTNLSGVTTPIDTRDVDLTGFAFARCAAFPCSSSGSFQDRSPAVFTSSYTIAPVTTPEPKFTLLIPVLLIGMVFGRRLVRPV
jgi:hypothetical protein